MANVEIVMRRMGCFLTVVPICVGVLGLTISGCQEPGPAVRSMQHRPEVSVRPGINESYRGPDVEKWIQRFENEDREIYKHRDAIVAAMGVRPGMVMADVGAGTGFMTLAFAEAVGAAGKVYAVDIKPEFLELIRERAAERGVHNVETVLCEERSVSLAANSVDLVFACDTYHHFEYPRSTMGSIHRALRPGGQLVVVEFDRIEGVSRAWVLNHVRADREETRAEICGDGFKWVEDVEVPFLEENYMMRFVKVE